MVKRVVTKVGDLLEVPLTGCKKAMEHGGQVLTFDKCNVTDKN
jgi:hypothetical protein